MGTEQIQGSELRSEGSEATYLVRLKPFDPRRGQTLRRYTFRGIRFRAEGGWHRVDLVIAEHLRGVQSRVGDPQAPLAFDVCSEEDARLLEKKEQLEQSTRRAATDVLPLTRARRAEPTSPRRRSAPKSGDEELDDSPNVEITNDASPVKPGKRKKRRS